MKSALLFFLFSTIIFAQRFEYVDSFGTFSDAGAMSVTSTGRIYVSDRGSNEVFMFDTLGYSLREIGGYGWQNDTFDDPVDLYAGPLSLFVCDYNNNAVKYFDKDLNLLAVIQTRESNTGSESFGYPLGCVTSNLGDLYILDGENIRIMHFDYFGNYRGSFAGFDYGAFAMNEPVRLAIAPDNKVFVIDKTDLLVFDSFGNGLQRSFLPDEFTDMTFFTHQVTLTRYDAVYTARYKYPELDFKKAELNGSPFLDDYVSSTLVYDKLYVLTSKRVEIFKRISE